MKLEVKKYRTKDGAEKVHHYRVNISKCKAELAGLGPDDEIMVFNEAGNYGPRIVIEKAKSRSR